MRILKRLLTSKRFIATLAAIATPLINEWTGLGLSSEDIIGIMGILAAFIIGDTVRPLDPEKDAEDRASAEEIGRRLGDRIRDRLNRRV